MNKTTKRLIIISIVSLLMALLVLIIKGFDKAINYCYAFFISVMLIVCVGWLSFVSNCGAFDIFGYSFKTIKDSLTKEGIREYQNMNEYVESKKVKRTKEKLYFLPYIIIGGIFFLMAIIIRFFI